MEKTTKTSHKDGLIHPERYFLRYAELLAEKKRAESAWMQVERELWKETGGFRRFLSARAASVCYSNYHNGKGAKNIKLTYSDVEFSNNS